jgi:hypothetical protein
MKKAIGLDGIIKFICFPFSKTFLYLNLIEDHEYNFRVTALAYLRNIYDLTWHLSLFHSVHSMNE